MAVPQYPHVAKVFECLVGSVLRQRAEGTIPPESTGNLQIQYMRCMHQPRSMKPLGENHSRARMHRQFNNCRSIQYDHRPSRIFRILTAAGSRSFTGSRVAIWSSRSSIVGRLAISLISSSSPKRHASCCGARLQLAMPRIRNMANLNHLRHVPNILTCASHGKRSQRAFASGVFQ